MKKQKFVIGAVLFWCVLSVSGAAWCGDNRNGTVTVNGLVWLKNPGCLGSMNWDAAIARPKSLAHGQCDLSDNSKIGDWRLPTLEELRAVYSYREQFRPVQARYYWSSTTTSGTPYAWYVGMNDADMGYTVKGYTFYVWPVRAGR